MRIHCKYTGIKGFLTVYNHAVRYAYMITAEAKMRLKILGHWKRYGLESVIHAFEISERALWDWKARLNKGGRQAGGIEPQEQRSQRKAKTVVGCAHSRGNQEIERG